MTDTCKKKTAQKILFETTDNRIMYVILDL